MHAQTKRQREVFDLIARYLDTHGYRPSYQMIARHLGLRSRAGIARIVHDLESQGLLQRRREDGHFTIEMSTNSDVVAVQWLDNPSGQQTTDDLPQHPLSLPGFLLGGYRAESLRVFRVRDDAMAAAGILEGDIILLELRDFTRFGQAVVAVLNDEQTVLRKYYRVGADIELRTADEKGDTISVPANRVEIVGVYRGLVRPAI